MTQSLKAILTAPLVGLVLLALFIASCSSPSPKPTPSSSLTPSPTLTMPSLPRTASSTPAPSSTLVPSPTPAASPTAKRIQQYSYKVVHVYPHDSRAFTQGLVFDNGYLYEGTGLNGQSTLRKVELETGKVLQVRKLADQYFGEGIAIYKDRIVQLTWQQNVGFVYDKSSFELRRQFSYPTEGWGITYDGKRLIMSDGTSTLHFLDPESFAETGRIQVYDDNGPVVRLNELEYVRGEIYANVWQTDGIAIISPQTGKVTGWIDLKGLINQGDPAQQADVLNGIAYDEQGGRLFVTGKLWPNVFEITLLPAN